MLTRFRTFVLFAALVALATAFVACGDDGGNSSSGENPQAVLEEATLKGVESGNLDLSLGLVAEGENGGDVDISLSGPFQGEAEGEQLPELDMNIESSGSVNDEDVDFEGGLVLLSNKAYVNYEGTEYEVDPTTFGFVKSAIQQQGGAEANGVTPCQKAVGKINFAEFVDDASNDGSADVDGTSTTKVSGDLDTSAAIDLLVEMAEDPACKKQLNTAGPLPSTAELEEGKDEVKSAVKDAHVELYVGDDGIVRRTVAELTIEPEGSGDDSEAVELDLDMTLSGVNESQTISAPSGAKPLSDLFLKLDINPIELLGLLSGESGLSATEGGLGGLLEGLSGGSGGGDRQAYLKCLQSVQSAADLQRCAGLK